MKNNKQILEWHRAAAVEILVDTVSASAASSKTNVEGVAQSIANHEPDNVSEEKLKSLLESLESGFVIPNIDASELRLILREYGLNV